MALVKKVVQITAISYHSVRSSRTTYLPLSNVLPLFSAPPLSKAAPFKFAQDDPYRDFLSKAFAVTTLKPAHRWLFILLKSGIFFPTHLQLFTGLMFFTHGWIPLLPKCTFIGLHLTLVPQCNMLMFRILPDQLVNATELPMLTAEHEVQLRLSVVSNCLSQILCN